MPNAGWDYVPSGSYNYALNKPVTASSCITPYLPQRAVNGTLTDPTDRWLSGFFKADHEKLFYKVDFGAVYNICRYVIKGICALPTADGVKWPVSYFNIPVSAAYSTDDNLWYDIDDCDTPESEDGLIDRSFSPVDARYFKLTFPGGIEANPNFVSIAQLEVYNTHSNYLSALTLSTGTLYPAFSQAHIGYSNTVDPSVKSITVTPTAVSPSAVITVMGETVQSGGTSSPIPLGDEQTMINVLVSDAGYGQNYSIQVGKIYNASYLISLTMHENDAGKSIVPFDPAFNGHTGFYYKASVGYDALNTGDASTQVTLTATGASECVRISANNEPIQQEIKLNAGSVNSITVTSVDLPEDPQTYKIDVTMASSPYLNKIDGITGISFSKTTLGYSAMSYENQMIFTPTADDASAAITVIWGSNTRTVMSGTAVKISLSSGPNAIKVKVVSSVGTDSRTYVFNVYH